MKSLASLASVAATDGFGVGVIAKKRETGLLEQWVSKVFAVGRIPITWVLAALVPVPMTPAWVVSL